MEGELALWDGIDLVGAVTLDWPGELARAGALVASAEPGGPLGLGLPIDTAGEVVLG